MQSGEEIQVTDVIRLLEQVNPKRGKSRFRFACYRDGMTIGEYEAAVWRQLGDIEAAKCKADIKWDSDQKRGLIRVERSGRPITVKTPRSLQHP